MDIFFEKLKGICWQLVCKVEIPTSVEISLTSLEHAPHQSLSSKIWNREACRTCRTCRMIGGFKDFCMIFVWFPYAPQGVQDESDGHPSNRLVIHTGRSLEPVGVVRCKASPKAHSILAIWQSTWYQMILNAKPTFIHSWMNFKHSLLISKLKDFYLRRPHLWVPHPLQLSAKDRVADLRGSISTPFPISFPLKPSHYLS